jgi:hypothetical protein
VAKRKIVTVSSTIIFVAFIATINISQLLSVVFGFGLFYLFFFNFIGCFKCNINIVTIIKRLISALVKFLKSSVARGLPRFLGLENKVSLNSSQ